MRKAKEKAERDEVERQERLRQDRISHLLAEADAFDRAMRIRDYVKSVRSVATQLDAEVLERWAGWALAVADDIDPVLNGSFIDHELGESK